MSPGMMPHSSRIINATRLYCGLIVTFCLQFGQNIIFAIHDEKEIKSI